MCFQTCPSVLVQSSPASLVSSKIAGAGAVAEGLAAAEDAAAGLVSFASKRWFGDETSVIFTARPVHCTETGRHVTPASSLRKSAPAVSMASSWRAFELVESAGRWLGRVGCFFAIMDLLDCNEPIPIPAMTPDDVVDSVSIAGAALVTETVSLTLPGEAGGGAIGGAAAAAGAALYC